VNKFLHKFLIVLVLVCLMCCICLVVDKGPLHGLQLTLNIQNYENLPFADEDSGAKVS